MRKILLIVVMLFLLMFTMLNGEKAGVLTDVLKPESIEVSGDRLYVVQSPGFFVYSLKDLALITKFGKKGEGPGELPAFAGLSNAVTELEDKLMVEGFSKMIYFSKDFKLQKEIKKPGRLRTLKALPVGKNFASIRNLQPTETDKKYYLALALLDENLNLLKILYKQEFPERATEIVMVTDSIRFAVYKDKIYVEESEKGFFIEVFDSSGNKVSQIRQNITRQKITENHRKAIYQNFKEDDIVRLLVKQRGGWESFEKKIKLIYPGTFPPIRDIIVTGDKIYAYTYERKDNKEKYIVMDLNGKIIDTVFMPIPKVSSFLSQTMGRGNRFYGIRNNTFYYLHENEENEEWELHAEKIK
ncbi:MAG: hypothetical protein GY950_28495 [bacterium]|nr:hypothetical protein [bacterium]